MASVFSKPNSLPDNLPPLLLKAANPPNHDVFWLYLQALKKFIDTHHRTPVSGNIPDFHADTKSYLGLKNAYNDMAAEDHKLLKTYLKSIVPKGFVMDEEDFHTFCKNWFTLEAYHYRSLADEYKSPSTDWVDECEPGFGWYFIIRAQDVFCEEHNRPPGPNDASEVLSRARQMAALALGDLAQENGFVVEEKFADEM